MVSFTSLDPDLSYCNTISASGSMRKREGSYFKENFMMAGPLSPSLTLSPISFSLPFSPSWCWSSVGQAIMSDSQENRNGSNIPSMCYERNTLKYLLVTHTPTRAHLNTVRQTGRHGRNTHT